MERSPLARTISALALCAAVGLAACGDSPIPTDLDPAFAKGGNGGGGGGKDRCPKAPRGTEAIFINPSSANLLVGGTQDFNIVNDAGQDVPDCRVRWSSSDETVVSIDEAGVATALADGAEVTITAQMGGGKKAKTAMATVRTALAGVDAARSTLSATPTAISANGTDAVTVTVTALDAFGNAVPGVAVTISVSGDGNSITQPAAVTDASGVATGTFTTTAAGSKTVSATAGGVSISGTETVIASASALAWYPAPSLPRGVAGGAAAATSDGERIYVVDHLYTDNIYIFEPTTGTWTEGAPHRGTTSGWLMIAALPGSGVHMISENPDASHTVYDVNTNQWTPRAPIPTRRRAGATQVVGGKLYVIGGVGGGVSFHDVVEVYDPATDSWTTGAPMPTPRQVMASAVIDDLIYIAGGETTGLQHSNVLERYDPATDQWQALAPIPLIKYRPGGGSIEGMFCVFGGASSWNNGTGHPETFCYDPTSGSWSQEQDLPTERGAIPTASLAGSLYAIGGYQTVDGSYAVGLTVVEVLRR